MKALSTVVCLAALLPLQAMALDPSACAGVVVNPAPGELPPPPPADGSESPWLRHEYNAPVDLGGGWVVWQYELASDAGTQFGAQVVDCTSGVWASVVEAGQRPDEPVNRIARLPAADAFRAAIASDEVISLEAVLAQLSDAGANVGIEPMHLADSEACGCAAFYPELRGTKTAWSSQ